ncbi:hypothetical protein K3G63_06625 [Hymenobacter sp. HSC-4F20]|uniref:hypothetical protein n=1 Tax=Hymenobacter sp. HSC-4F20 TaxID=2864135 RepID=UPI001C737240|nr:hypothetical protein [Hymenobacter sp. HSC-4F20]MBX0290105.1 hypothetical protein [Hymenobacter sp. HSC-4F20]
MPKNIKYTDNQAIDAAGNQLKQAAGNVQVRFDSDLNEFELLAPVGETIQDMSLNGTSLQVRTNQTTRSVNLAALVGQDTRIVDLYLAGKQLQVDTQVGNFSVDLGSLVPASVPAPVAVQSLSAPGGYLLATLTDGSQVEIDMSDFMQFLLSLAQEAIQINSFTRSGNVLTINTNAKGNQSVDLSDLAGGGGTATTDASLLTSGTLADARLSLNVPLKNANNTYTGLMTVQNDILMKGVGNYAQVGDSATVYFGDTNHGFRGTAGGGVQIFSWRVPHAITVRQVTGQIGFGLPYDQIEYTAQVQVNSTTKGSLLAPRMSEAQRLAIWSPAQGLQVYQTDGTEGLYVFTNSAGWSLIGGVVGGGGGEVTKDYVDAADTVLQDRVSDAAIHSVTFSGDILSVNTNATSYPVDLSSLRLTGGSSYDDTVLRSRVSAVEGDKVDKEDGKGLSQEDFTTAYRAKLDSLQNSPSGGTTYDNTALQARVGAVEDGKVDKVTGKQLSTEDYTSTEKTKLASLKNYSEGTGISISAGGVISATGGGSMGTGYDDTAIKSRVTAVETAVVTKVEQVPGKQLTDVNFSQADKAKLDSLQNSTATSYDDTALQARVTGVENGKVDKVAGKGLTDVNFTQADKAKLDSLQNTTDGATYDDTNLRNRVTAVENGKLSNAPRTVTGAHIAQDTISTDNFTDHCITETQLAFQAVGTTALKDSSVTGAKLTSNSVSTAKVQDQAITTAKIANETVQWYQLAHWAVVEDKIKDDNVTLLKLSPEVRAMLAAVNTKQIEFNYCPGSNLIEFVVGPNQAANYTSFQYQNISVIKIEQYTVNGLLVIYDGTPPGIPALNLQTNMRLKITISQNDSGAFSFVNFSS